MPFLLFVLTVVVTTTMLFILAKICKFRTDRQNMQNLRRTTENLELENNREKKQKTRKKTERKKSALWIENLTLIQKEINSDFKLIGNVISHDTEWILPAVKIVINNKNLADKIFPITFKIINQDGETVYEKTIRLVLKLGENIVASYEKLNVVRAKKYFGKDLFWSLGFMIHGKMITKIPILMTKLENKTSFSDFFELPLTASDGELTNMAKTVIKNIKAPDLQNLLDN